MVYGTFMCLVMTGLVLWCVVCVDIACGAMVIQVTSFFYFLRKSLTLEVMDIREEA